MLFPIVSASLGHMMGEVSAVSQGSRSLRDDRPQVPFLLWFIRVSQFSVMEIHLNQRPFTEPVRNHTGHLWAGRHGDRPHLAKWKKPFLMQTFTKQIRKQLSSPIFRLFGLFLPCLILQCVIFLLALMCFWPVGNKNRNLSITHFLKIEYLLQRFCCCFMVQKCLLIFFSFSPMHRAYAWALVSWQNDILATSPLGRKSYWERLVQSNLRSLSFV